MPCVRSTKSMSTTVTRQMLATQDRFDVDHDMPTWHHLVWACGESIRLQVCKEEADRMRLGLPLSGEFRKTRQKKYKEKHEQGRIAAAGLCLLRGENGTPEVEEGVADQQKQLEGHQQQQQPDPAAHDATAADVVLPATEVLHPPAPILPAQTDISAVQQG